MQDSGVLMAGAIMAGVYIYEGAEMRKQPSPKNYNGEKSINLADM